MSCWENQDGKGKFLKVVREGLGGLEIGVVSGVLVLGGARDCCWMQCCLKSPFLAQWVQGAQSPLVSELGRSLPGLGTGREILFAPFLGAVLLLGLVIFLQLPPSWAEEQLTCLGLMVFGGNLLPLSVEFLHFHGFFPHSVSAARSLVAYPC